MYANSDAQIQVQSQIFNDSVLSNYNTVKIQYKTSLKYELDIIAVLSDPVFQYLSHIFALPSWKRNHVINKCIQATLIWNLFEI